MKEKMPLGLKIGKKSSLAIKQIRRAKKNFKQSECKENSYQCECCCYPTDGLADICKRCGWEQVGTFEKTGANPVSLLVYKKLFERYGVSNVK